NGTQEPLHGAENIDPKGLLSREPMEQALQPPRQACLILQSMSRYSSAASSLSSPTPSTQPRAPSQIESSPSPRPNILSPSSSPSSLMSSENPVPGSASCSVTSLGRTVPSLKSVSLLRSVREPSL